MYFLEPHSSRRQKSWMYKLQFVSGMSEGQPCRLHLKINGRADGEKCLKFDFKNIYIV